MPAQKFLITGLPRCRTAWLSVLCTIGGSMCYHEPMARMVDISDLEQIYSSEYYKHIGVADSGLGFFLDWILKNMAPRTLIVERDPKEVTESLFKLGVARSNYSHLLLEKLQEFRDHPLVMWVPFEALNTKRVVQRVFWHLLPGMAFDEERYEQLEKTKIETDPARTFKEAEKHKDQLARLMRDILPKIKMTEKQNASIVH